MKNKGFTLIELLVVIAIIGLLAGILLPVLNKVQVSAMRAECKATINQLSQALKTYEEVENGYPPNVGTQEGTTYAYSCDILAPCLDGNTVTTTGGYGNNRRQYFEFKENQLAQWNTGTGEGDTNAAEANEKSILDRFLQPVWYYNFQPPFHNFSSKQISGNPLHPWTNALLFANYQMYSKANYPDNAYGDETPNAEKFRWITSYTE
jgi:prepilin-type N-terminal cleavage/methylation domain-containing protein